MEHLPDERQAQQVDLDDIRLRYRKLIYELLTIADLA